MPCDAQLDLTRRWVIARAWGVVTFADMVAARRKFTSDPNFAPDFCQLIDAREVTRVSISPAEVGVLAVVSIFGPKSRRAFVAPTREAYDLGHMYQTYRKINAAVEQIKIFRTLEEAEAWLADSPHSPPAAH